MVRLLFWLFFLPNFFTVACIAVVASSPLRYPMLLAPLAFLFTLWFQAMVLPCLPWLIEDAERERQNAVKAQPQPKSAG